MNSWEKKGVKLLKRRFFAAMQDGFLEVGTRTKQGNLRVAEIPLFYSRWQNGWFKVKSATKSIIYNDAFCFSH
ncbi:hypothetical protein [Enterobacter roggenkampii]